MVNNIDDVHRKSRSLTVAIVLSAVGVKNI